MSSWRQRPWPGFRSGKRWKKIVAALGYGMIALFLISGLTGYASAFVTALVGIAMVLLMADFRGVRSALPMVGSTSAVTVVIGWAVVSLAGFGIVAAASAVLPAPHASTPRPLATDQARATSAPPIVRPTAERTTSAPRTPSPTPTPRTPRPTPSPSPTISCANARDYLALAAHRYAGVVKDATDRAITASEAKGRLMALSFDVERQKLHPCATAGQDALWQAMYSRARAYEHFADGKFDQARAEVRSEEVYLKRYIAWRDAGPQ